MSEKNSKLDCGDVQPHLSEFVDGRLSSDKTWIVQKHLAVCTGCSHAVREIEATVLLLRQLPGVQVRTAFDSSLRDRITAARQARGTASPVSKVIDGIRLMFAAGTSRVSYGPRRLAGSLALPLACLTLFGIYAVTLPSHISQGPEAIAPAMQAPLSDTALVEKCMSDHRTFVTGEPLADPSAQVLATQVDTMTKTTDSSGSLNDQDAAVLLADGT